MKHNRLTIEAVIFDLDGTLVNTAPDVRLALNKALELFSYKPISQNEIYSLIGHGAQYMIEKAVQINGGLKNPEEIQKILFYYLTFYQQNPVVETKIYPHVMQVLAALKKDGKKLAICTNKPAVMTKLVLHRLQMNNFFEVVISGDELLNPKPHPEHLRAILHQLNVSSACSVMVGDSKVDKEAAANIKMPFIGVTYGYDGGKHFNEDRLITDFSELYEIVIQKSV